MLFTFQNFNVFIILHGQSSTLAKDFYSIFVEDDEVLSRKLHQIAFTGRIFEPTP